jgi:NhaP-type Na+/H+ or K+/H+ antiporter
MRAADGGSLKTSARPLRQQWRPITMLAIIALVLIAIVALTVLGFAVHVLFSPWLLLAVIGILAWVKFRPGRSRQ